MQLWVIDIAIVVLILGVTYALTSEGAWGAALMFFDILFAGLIAFNFYETLAKVLVGAAPGMAGWADMLCLAGLFLVGLILFRIITDSIAPTMLRLPKPVYQLGRFGFGVAAAAVLMGILLCIFQTAPVHRRVFGSMLYDSKSPYGLGLDRKWLAFVQYSTENSFSAYDEEGKVRMFDPKGAWQIDHQNARPFPFGGNPDLVPGGEGGDAAPAAPAAGAADAPAG